MKEAKNSTVPAIAIALAGIWAVMAAGITLAWPTEEVRVVGLVAVPAALVAGLLVACFEWRTRLQRRILAPREDVERFDEPAQGTPTELVSDVSLYARHEG